MVLRDLSILLKIFYVRNFSVLKRRRNLKMLMLFFVFGYLLYVLASSTQLQEEDPTMSPMLTTKHSIDNEIAIEADGTARKKALEIFEDQWKDYSKIKSNGVLGNALDIKKDSLPTSERLKFDKGWENHAFNEYASTLIPLNRTLVDIRHKG